MKKHLIAFVCAALPLNAQAASLSATDAAPLEGQWQVNGEAGPACGQNFTYGIKMGLEFRLTGGQISFDDGAEGAGPQTIVSAEKTGGVYVLHLKDDDTAMRIKLAGKKLTITTAGAEGFIGKTFTQCLAGEPRSAIQLGKADMTFLATTMLPQVPRFVDARAKGGCRGAQYQYLSFDLANATFPEIRRENSDALAAALANHKKVTAPVDSDGLGRWAIEGAAKTATGYDFTVTELIPPNGSRGDKSKLEIQRTAGGIAVPAWKRSYLRCPQEE